jgi:uncharacterized protein (TIGR00297 family)
MTMLEVFTIMIPEHNSIELLISLTICISLGVFSYWRRILDARGAIASFLIGLIIAVFANIFWLITLICFLLVTYTVTKMDFSYKQAHGLAQGRHGERRLRNVLANGSILAFIAVFRFQIGYPTAGLLFITGICIAASDSFANEIGVLSNRTYLITNLNKRVRPGTHGGVSSLGQTAAIIGAFIPAMIGWFLISEFNENILSIGDNVQMPMSGFTLLLPIIMGFVGCQIDSLLGATFQRQGLINNDQVNFLSILITVLLTYSIILVIQV